MDDDLGSFVAKLQALREAGSWTYADIAKHLGRDISSDWVSKIFRGKDLPTAALLENIISLLAIAPAEANVLRRLHAAIRIKKKYPDEFIAIAQALESGGELAPSPERMEVPVIGKIVANEGGIRVDLTAKAGVLSLPREVMAIPASAGLTPIIQQGDSLLVIEQPPTATLSGVLVVASLRDGSTVVRRIFPMGGRFLLAPAATADREPPIEIAAAEVQRLWRAAGVWFGGPDG